MSVGKFQDQSGRSMARPGERWSDTLLRRAEEANLIAKIRGEQQRLGVAESDWVGGERNQQVEEQEEEEQEEEEEEEEEEEDDEEGSNKANGGTESSEIGSNNKYLNSGPPFLIRLHPALGPLWEVTIQKFTRFSLC